MIVGTAARCNVLTPTCTRLGISGSCHEPEVQYADATMPGGWATSGLRPLSESSE